MVFRPWDDKKRQIIMNRRIQQAGTVVFLGLAVAACGQKLSGSYRGDGTGFIDEMRFGPGDKVAITGFDRTDIGSYKIDGKRVTIILPGGESQIFVIDEKKCLFGGTITGRLCPK